ncbi:leucine-rich PPR motif-containing protein, mitochondrial isoform X2 [Entelurus aequoreus]|uniref:leucine-rich PPR motif-containing protein, mitochondrial isoform X2 n=1 Tax=Entelurus aequoreus TaxID=161455 RepID=UPI002B1E1E75|nr:leucine-rich PPR motif-containing protein, mitochondrial isoform X2 [Entelurus aequoreus]
MAALLRSARLLKLTPSGLLQITGTKRTGPPLSRLYSGALSVNRTGVLSRQSRPGVEGTCRQAQHFDWALAKLDNSVRRTGRITKTMLLRIFHGVCREGYPSSNQALLLLRSCGTLLPEMVLQERTHLAHRIWGRLNELGARYDVSHYNALLKVYLQNEFRFSPMDFLDKMEVAKLQPNRVTYQRLITAYCQTGDIQGASAILGFMKSKDLPITEAVFNSLVTGHARSGDLESAKNILSVMRGAGIDPGPDTYVSLMNGYAEKGDLDSLKKTLEEAESANISLVDRDLMQVIFTLAKAGHQQHVPEMMEHLRQERGYIPDAMNLCLSLITQGLDETAFAILKTFSTPNPYPNGELKNFGSFFLRHCIYMDTPLEKISHYCKELQDSNMHAEPFSFTLFCTLEAKKIDVSLELMKLMQEQNFPIRPHYFWPLLIQHAKDNNTTGAVKVIKGMQQLGLDPDIETISNYLYPVFSSTEAAQQALKDAGITVPLDGLLTSNIRFLASNHLTQLYTLLSDPSHPPVDMRRFRSSLIHSFRNVLQNSANCETVSPLGSRDYQLEGVTVLSTSRRFDDINCMVKLTKLFYNDERYTNPATTTNAEAVAYLLYNLFEGLQENKVQEQEDKLRDYVQQLKAENIVIPARICRGIRNILAPYNVPDLIKDVYNLVDPKELPSNKYLSSNPCATDLKPKALENRLAELKAENKPLSFKLKQTILALSSSKENMQRALELKQQYEDQMTSGAYAILISLCCSCDNVDEAMSLKREMSRKDSSVVLDASKYIMLVKLLAKNDRLEEAVDILKEMKEKDVVLNDNHLALLFHTLNEVMSNGAPAVQHLQDTIFTLGLAKPSANLCAPLISVYLNSDDLPGAVEAMLECQKRYKLLPRIHDIIVGLIEKGNTELLQKAMDIVSQERGEMTMLYYLLFAFLQTGRYSEARKIFETPGLRAKPGRLQWFAEKCVLTQQMEPLEQMVDMTSKLFECDRDEMYNYILRLCKDTNDWQKAEAVWTKMQEENIVPRERTLHLLAEILKNNGQEVPFEVPETFLQYEREANDTQSQPAKPAAPSLKNTKNGSEYQMQMISLCKKGNAKAAFAMLKESNKNGVAVGPLCYDYLIRALLGEGSLEDAMVVRDIAMSDVQDFQLSDIANSLRVVTLSKRGQAKDALDTLKSMLQNNQVPSSLAVTRLIQSLASLGDVEGIKEVSSLMEQLGTSLNLSSMVFTKNMALAHIKNDDLESAVEMLEELYTRPDNKNPSIVFVFRKILMEENDKALDKLSAMAERLANHFACYRPATDLFIQLLEMDKVEDAKFMLARNIFIAEQKEALISYLARLSSKPGKTDKINTLLSLIPDFVEKEALFPYMMQSHVADNDLASAKKLYERMQEEGVVADELSLKRLAMLYHKAGETVPFSEPPKSVEFYLNKPRKGVAKSRPAEE